MSPEVLESESSRGQPSKQHLVLALKHRKLNIILLVRRSGSDQLTWLQSVSDPHLVDLLASRLFSFLLRFPFLLPILVRLFRHFQHLLDLLFPFVFVERESHVRRTVHPLFCKTLTLVFRVNFVDLLIRIQSITISPNSLIPGCQSLLSKNTSLFCTNFAKWS